MAEFSVLGEVGACVAGRVVNIGHGRQRCVLAALLVDVNRIVSFDLLVGRVWGDDPPSGVRSTVYSYVSRLRAAVPGIVRASGGYGIEADPVSVDLHRFRLLVGSARADQDDRYAAQCYERAAGLWRGEAFAGLRGVWAGVTRDQLAAERRTAQLDWTDVQLRLGRHSSLVPSLTTWHGEQPLDERVAGQLMLAQFGNGMREAALATYRRLQVRLGEELGVDPCGYLRELHQRVLVADPSLTWSVPN